jgi:sec-independent protein translocase protein TatA
MFLLNGFLLNDVSLLNDGLIVAFGFSPGPTEMLVILGIALLLYGGRLPEMARSWGKTLAEFRRGLSGIQNDLNDAMYSPPEQIDYYPEEQAAPYSDDTVDEYRSEEQSAYDDEPSYDEESAETETFEVDTPATDTPETGTAMDSSDNPAEEGPAEEKPSAIDTD